MSSTTRIRSCVFGAWTIVYDRDFSSVETATIERSTQRNENWQHLFIFASSRSITDEFEIHPPLVVSQFEQEGPVGSAGVCCRCCAVIVGGSSSGYGCGNPDIAFIILARGINDNSLTVGG